MQKFHVIMSRSISSTSLSSRGSGSRSSRSLNRKPISRPASASRTRSKTLKKPHSSRSTSSLKRSNKVPSNRSLRSARSAADHDEGTRSFCFGFTLSYNLPIHKLHTIPGDYVTVVSLSRKVVAETGSDEVKEFLFYRTEAMRRYSRNMPNNDLQ